MKPAFKKPSPFAQAQSKAPKAAPLVVELAPSYWADGRKAKPTSPVSIGLKRLPECEFDRARAIAEKDADRNHPQRFSELWIECYNARLIGYLMAEASCLPHDVNVKFFEVADVKIFLDLTPQGIAYLWDHYDAFVQTDSPSAPEATDDELTELAYGMLSGDVLASLTGEDEKRFRRLLKAAIKLAIK